MDEDRTSRRFFKSSQRRNHHMFDLPGYIARRLADAGILTVVDLGVCTYREERFFSYRRATHRRHDNYGRQISAICLAR